ncbi:MAG: homocysteine S-methyltransferase family protein [Romboutsia sp.]|nr:homocysteine S-methyltransferase family protein [Romboutsia sp.]
MDLIDYIKSNILLLDGAMGTMLQQNGLNIGENTEVFGFENPDKVMQIHKSYLDAGANVITTNTFGANEIRLEKTKYSVEEIVDSAENIAKIAVE